MYCAAEGSGRKYSTDQMSGVPQIPLLKQVNHLRMIYEQVHIHSELAYVPAPGK